MHRSDMLNAVMLLSIMQLALAMPTALVLQDDSHDAITQPHEVVKKSQMDCNVYGDPHVKSWTGATCDLYGLGIFPMISLQGFQVQTMFCPPPRTRIETITEVKYKKMRASVIVGTAVRIGNDIVTIVGNEMIGNGVAIPITTHGEGSSDVAVGALTVHAYADPRKGNTQAKIEAADGTIFNLTNVNDAKSATGSLQNVHAYARSQETDGYCANVCADGATEGAKIRRVDGHHSMFSASQLQTMMASCNAVEMDQYVACGATPSAASVCTALSLNSETARAACQAGCPGIADDKLESCIFDYCEMGEDTAIAAGCADDDEALETADGASQSK